MRCSLHVTLADHIIFMDEGIIVEQGKPEEVFGAPKQENEPGSSLRVILKIENKAPAYPELYSLNIYC